jgi:hypothetical protein
MVPAWLYIRQVQTFHRNDPLQQHRAHTMWAGDFSIVQTLGAATNHTSVSTANTAVVQFCCWTAIASQAAAQMACTVH